MAKSRTSSTTISIRFDNDNVTAGIEVLKEFAKLILEKFDDVSTQKSVEVAREHPKC